MTTVMIPDTFMLTSAQAAEMLQIPQNRVKYLLQNADVPHERTKGGRSGHYRIAFKDLEKLSEADLRTKRMGRTKDRLGALTEALSALEDRVEFLETYALLSDDGQVAR